MAACSSPYNLARFCDPEIDAQTKRAAGARGQEASALWQRAETSLADQAPIVPLVNSNDISLTAERVGNYQFHPLWGPLIEQLWVN
jgi:peptide/nickel transport system substrate-binding protein